MITKRAIVLLTSTINPNSMINLKRSDTNMRLIDYKTSLESWIEDPNVHQIIYCDNSNYSLSEFVQLDKSNKVEFLSFDGNKNKMKGKGFGELEILDYVIRNSKVLLESDIIIKVTGRLYVRNIDHMLTRLDLIKSFDVICDLRSDLTWADTRLFICNKNFIREFLLFFKEKIDEKEGHTFEHIFASATHRAISYGKKWHFLTFSPIFEGFSATSNTKYPSTKLAYLKREIFRRIKEFIFAS